MPDMVGSGLEMIQGRLRRQNIEIEVEHGDAPPDPLRPLPDRPGDPQPADQRHPGDRGHGPDRGADPDLDPQEGDSGPEVADNGAGIAPEHLPRLFDPFFTTKPVGEGTGLGLSISHGIVTGHGGRIEVEARPGGGTVFRVFLPLNPS